MESKTPSAKLQQCLGDLHALGTEFLSELVDDGHLAVVHQARSAGAHAGLTHGLGDLGALLHGIENYAVEVLISSR